ncbi:MAG: hypothetical protein WCZ08_03260 [Parcubacteria group bacterium]|jgi:hypothetical protein
MDNMQICPQVCVEQIKVSFTVIGFVFVFFSFLTIYLLKNKLTRKALIFLVAASTILFILLLNFKYDACASGCSSSGLSLGEIKPVPSWFINH